MEKIYLFLLKKLLKGKKNIILAKDWTVIREKYNFLSISWVFDSNHSIPIFFTGYEKKDFKQRTKSDYYRKRKYRKSNKNTRF